ncbi:MAG: hypothetical protein JXR86_17230 [Spirochaetales bacterium]|nr:hypothetical protein [Spirochaetales bacterium]
MGLLDKALTLESEMNAETEESLHFNPDLDKIYETLISSTKSLDFPSALFSGLVKELQITKGALLLPDGNDVYTPWAVEGFDQTTSRRIRIPDSFLSIQNMDLQSHIDLESDEIDQLKEFFSFREYSVTTRVCIAPMKDGNTVIALLFISASGLFYQDRKFISKILQATSDKMGPLLKEKRDTIFSKLEVLSKENNDISKRIIKMIDSESSPFSIISLHLQTIIKQIMNRDKNFVEFRIIEDIVRLVKTLLGDRGDVFIRDSRSIHIVLMSSRNEEAELFIHQIGLSLSFFYKLDENRYEPDWHIVRYPEDGNSYRDLLQKLEQ